MNKKYNNHFIIASRAYFQQYSYVFSFTQPASGAHHSGSTSPIIKCGRRTQLPYVTIVLPLLGDEDRSVLMSISESKQLTKNLLDASIGGGGLGWTTLVQMWQARDNVIRSRVLDIR